MVGIVERVSELFAQRLGPRVPVRLKHRQHALASGGFRGLQCRRDFGRVMGVIIHEQKTLALVFDLEPAARVLEPA